MVALFAHLFAHKIQERITCENIDILQDDYILFPS